MEKRKKKASNLYYQQQRFIVFRRTQLNREAFPAPFFFSPSSLEKMKYTASEDGGGEKKKKLMVPFFSGKGSREKKSRVEGGADR